MNGRKLRLKIVYNCRAVYENARHDLCLLHNFITQGLGF